MKTEVRKEDRGDTWPKILRFNYEKYGAKHKAMRKKLFGIWQSYSWQDYYHNVKYLALGLLALGFKKNAKLLIIGDNAPEWYFAELAAQSNHGISVGLYSDLTPGEIQYIVTDSEASFALVEDQEQVDKLLESKQKLPLLKKIIYWRYKGLSNYKNPEIIGYRQVIELGKKYENDHFGLFEENIATGKADDICSLVYTSGTTGENPKGAMHSFKTMKYGSDCYLDLDPIFESDNIMSYLPPAWITEQWLGIGSHLLSGCIANFPEGVETQQQDIREIGPTMVFYNARLWETQASRVQSRMQGTDFIKKFIYHLFLPVGYKVADMKFKNIKPGLLWKLLHSMGDLVIFRPIRDNLGLINARICYSAGSSLSPDIIRFFHALNVPLKSLYGSTEGGALTGAGNTDIKPETVGPLHPGIEIEISKDGEIYSRHPGMFLGYYNNSKATADVLKNGWFCSGDCGYLTQEGHLVFVDRIEDIVKLKSGEQLAPQEIESRLKFSQYIKDAWVMAGPKNEYVAAVIIIDNVSIGPWADRHKVTHTTFSDLAQKPEVYELIRQEITKINLNFPAGCQIKKFVNLHKEFDPDEGELTRNRKLRKSFLAERYRGLVAAIYKDQSSVTLETQVKYRDGRIDSTKHQISIWEIERTKR
ncbi:MAG: AMP-binding protein [Dehalococcoidales bacterium]|nr:AMP-binding protein [Dehalococcoidales bacterium]